MEGSYRGPGWYAKLPIILAVTSIPPLLLLGYLAFLFRDW